MSGSIVHDNENITNAQLRKKLGALMGQVQTFIGEFGEKHNNVAKEQAQLREFALVNFGKIEAEFMRLGQAVGGLDLNVLAMARVIKKLFEMVEITGVVIEKTAGESAVLSKEDQLEVRLRSAKRYEQFVAEAFTEVQQEMQEQAARIAEQAARDKQEAEEAERAKAAAEAEEERLATEEASA